MKSLCFYVLLLLSVYGFSQQSGDKIFYYDLNNLSWDNIKGRPNLNDTLRECYLSTTFELRRLRVNAWTGKSKFQGYAIAYPFDSWVKDNCQNDQNLQYLQIFYDLAQVYAKRLETEFNKKYNPHLNILENQIDKAIKDYRYRRLVRTN